ncbi:glycosyltransferase family 4 protein [Variovorax ureilyticus]|uniref:Glycosyltransferase family 4 protein n=1 Tax=Variovorax ureilyticus TaxID=1836198 RepID=A0ABU8VA79_9BURK
MAADAELHVLMTADCVGGVWTHALELAGALGRRGVRVTLASLGARLTPHQRAAAACVPSLDLHESAWRLEWMDDPWDDVRAAGEWLLALERAVRPDVLHLNQFSFGALPFGAPKLVVAHSCVLSWWQAVRGAGAPRRYDTYRGAVTAGLEGAALVAAPTRSMLASLASHYGAHWQGAAIHNGRDPAAFAAGRKQPVILSAGRLWDDARNLAALEAVAPYLPWPVRVSGSAVHPCGGRRQLHGVEPLGELTAEALAAQFAAASIYALPARYEPFGQTALEAAFSGCALVLGDIPSLREIWGAAALYVPPDDHDALHEALTRLIEQPELRTAMGQRARLRAGRFTPQRMADGYLRTYRWLLGNRRRETQHTYAHRAAQVEALPEGPDAARKTKALA